MVHFDYVYMSGYFRLRYWELQPWICRALCCCLCVVVGEAWPGARCVYFLFNQLRRPESATGNWGTQPLWPGYRGDIGRAGYSWQRIWAMAWHTAEKLLAEGRAQVCGYKIPAVTVFIFVFTFAVRLCDKARRYNVQRPQGETPQTGQATLCCCYKCCHCYLENDVSLYATIGSHFSLSHNEVPDRVPVVFNNSIKHGVAHCKKAHINLLPKSKSNYKLILQKRKNVDAKIAFTSSLQKLHVASVLTFR